MTQGDDERDRRGRPDGLVLLGRIAGAQGLRGEVKINSFTAIPEDVASYGPLSDGKGRSFVIERLRALKGAAVAAQLAGVSDRNAAEALQGTELHVERSRLPEPDDDEWYIEDLVGLTATSRDGRPLGMVVAVQNFGAGDLLEIRLDGDRQTLLLPFTQDAVPVIDIKNARIIIEPPEEEDEQL